MPQQKLASVPCRRYAQAHVFPASMSPSFSTDVIRHAGPSTRIKHVHGAPNVSLSLAVLRFIKTPLFKRETRQSSFLFPLLYIDSVGEALADILYSGYGTTIHMPGMMRYAAMLVSIRLPCYCPGRTDEIPVFDGTWLIAFTLDFSRGAPEWMMRAVREGTWSLGVNFRGRQTVDKKTGRMS